MPLFKTSWLEQLLYIYVIAQGVMKLLSKQPNAQDDLTGEMIYNHKR